MLNKIVEYLDRDKIVVLLLIILLLVVLWNMYSCIQIDEGFENTQTCIDHKDKKFKSQFEGSSKVVNFRCNIDGKDYYLTSMPVLSCEKSDEKDIDCANNTLVLIPADEATRNLEKYLLDLKTNEKICNASKKITCESSQPSDEKSCGSEFEECKPKRKYVHDFVITEFIDENTKNKNGVRNYVIKGISSTDSKDATNVYASNIMHDTTKYVCANREFADNDIKLIALDDQKVTNGGIIGGPENKFTVKLAFHYQKKFGKALAFDGSDPIMGTSYLSVCKNNKCKSGNSEYLRVCTTENITDANVINFEPLLL